MWVVLHPWTAKNANTKLASSVIDWICKLFMVGVFLYFVDFWAIVGFTVCSFPPSGSSTLISMSPVDKEPINISNAASWSFIEKKASFVPEITLEKRSLPFAPHYSTTHTSFSTNAIQHMTYF